MKIPFKLGERTFFLEQYTSHQEKEILLMDSFEFGNFQTVFDILNFDAPDDLTEDEKKILLYKFREISLGDEINLSFVCKHCGQGQDVTIEASNFIQKPERNDPDIKKIFRTVNEDNLQDYVDVCMDELDIDEYEKLKQRIIDNQHQVSFIKTVKCLKCSKPKNYDISDPKYIIEIMSDETLMTLYKAYNHLIFFSHYTKTDIDSMYPFERDILSGLLTKTQEDLNK